MDNTSDGFSVNEKTAFLTVNSNNIPTVTLATGNSFTLPDHPWSRWYLKTHFQHMSADNKGATWYKLYDPTTFPQIKSLALPPKPHQILAINRMKLSNMALWLDMGLGKTFCSICFALLMAELGEFISLVLCPPSVFVSWKDDIKLFIKSEAKARIEILHGPKKLKTLAKIRTEALNTPTFLMTTYETLESIREQLQTMNISNIFFDESSKIKNWEAQRTQTAHALVNALPNSRRFCLSGTPATKSPLGLFSQYEILGKGFSRAPSFQAFEKRYAIQKTFMTVQLPHGRITSLEDTKENVVNWLSEHHPPNSSVSYAELGFSFSQKPQHDRHIRILNWHKRNVQYINQEELHSITQTHAYTLHKLDVLKDLPPKTRIVRSVELSAEQRKAYNEMLETSRTQIGSKPFSFHDTTSPHAKLFQIANGYLIHADKTITFFKQQPKLLELEQIIEELGEQKLVIWSSWRPQIAQIVNFLRNELELKCLELHGDTPQKDREGIVHAFQGNGADFLVANPAVGGLGLNLVSACTEIFASNWHSPDVRSQAEDRLWRIGQTLPVSVIDLTARNTLEVALRRQSLNEIQLERKLISMTVLMGGE